MKTKPNIVIALAVLVSALFIYLYQELRPTIIFHTYAESGYLGKIATERGYIHKLYIKNHRVKYKMPYLWYWKDDGFNEIGIFTLKYHDLLKKEDITFWKMDIFLDENGYYSSHSTTEYFWPLSIVMKGQRQ